ncbi:hypothetical protein [Aminobacter ciceronei]|uniref:Uncharacterized protein n=1 Tax=Aminobacter ciceronei TaxID=150723 RepID=A0ABR6C9M6_9HYPH|nr:hypothetical protein [Aminobacter ciceronei]MBA8907949.1 hypothetical protein [Aminobacter ciceronei]MBA9021704.1 hypothetical protein [Aminobacter ciceronei]
MAFNRNSIPAGASHKAPRRPDPEDIALWPDGSWAHLGDVWNGEFDWKSDDYEVIGHDDEERLSKTGILDQLE